MSSTPTARSGEHGVHESPEDKGTILVLVLVMIVIGSLIVLPLMTYTTSVFRAGRVQTGKSEAIELARGGTWVALSNQEDLYDMCDGSTLPGSLPNVSTTCTVVETSTQRPAAEIPYHVSVVQSDKPVPVQIASASDYPSPNSTVSDPADFDAWLDTPEWSWDPLANKVWVPQLPVQATSAGGTRDTTMIPGTEDPLYAGQTCRVFFPGTFSTPIDIDGPTYFTSGVYYFTEPVVLHNGADVVVGNGAEGGCTTDFEAIASAVVVPDPLNMSGLGGTFVLGDNAKIVVDDSGAGDIRFAMNQRYVSEDETSVAASLNVSIVSVNGTHEPLVGAEVLGDDLVVSGVIGVPASTVGTDGDPLAALSDYTPSNLTSKAYEPDAPTNLDSDDYQRGSGSTRGRLTVTWDAPADNGSPITGYLVTDSVHGRTCSPATPTPPDTTIQTSCVITGISHQNSSSRSRLTVTATNALGTSDPSAEEHSPRVDLSGGSQSPVQAVPDAPPNPVVANVYSDGIEIGWDPPAADGGAPVTGYRVTAKVPGPGGPVVDSCDAWWDETSCVLFGLTDSTIYHIDTVALQHESPPFTEFESAHAHLATGADLFVLLGGSAAPPPSPPVASSVPVPEPILDFTTTTSATTDIWIAGYVAVPQGRVEIDVVDPASTSVSMIGGLVSGDITIGAAVDPSMLDIRLDNPIAQKRVRIQSTTTGSFTARSDAVVQVNRSGSIAVNSWLVQ